MKKFLFFILSLQVINCFGAVGLFNAQNITLNGTTYSAGTNLGSFNANGLVLNGGSGNTYQNSGDDACHIVMEYAVSGGINSSQILNFFNF